VHKSSGTDDKKLQTTLKKMNVQPIQAIEEVNMFKEDGNVIHFAAPKGTLHVILRRRTIHTVIVPNLLRVQGSSCDNLPS
jgi:NACalpha-BTF3-like transcription factor